MELKGINWICLNKLFLNVFFENMILKLIIIEPSKEVNKSFLSFSKKVHPKSKSVGFKKKKKEE